MSDAALPADIAARPSLPPALEDAAALFCSDRPAIGVEQARAIACSVYGMDVTASVLPGERDANFLLCDARGGRTVLKVMNAAETAEDARFVSRIMAHLAEAVRADRVTFPAIVPTREGRDITRLRLPGVEGLMARMVGWVAGEPMRARAFSPRLAHDTGRAVGLMARALRDIGDPAHERVILWDSLHVDGLDGLLPLVTSASRRDAIAAFLDRFRQRVRPALATLPRQPIHNDLNGSNLLVAAGDGEHVVGIVDFGDAVMAPRINDLAVAASYQSCDGVDPLAGVVAMLQGFATVVTPDGIEVDLLFDLVVARLALRVLLTEWRSVLFPENRDYIRRNSMQAVGALDALLALPPGRGRAVIRDRWTGAAS